MTVVFLVALGSYLIGGIPFSYIAGRLIKGIDLREHGSGNLGASNTFRMLGPVGAVPVLLLDIAKGVVPVMMASSGEFESSLVAAHWLPVIAMFAAIFGHMFSPYLKFSGGKGIATSAGAFAALAPWAFLGALILFVIVFAARRIVSLASLCAAISLPLFVFLAQRAGKAQTHWSLLAVSGIIMAIVIVKHRSNIRRLIAGTEPVLARKRS